MTRFTLVLLAFIVIATAAEAAATPEQQCQKGRYDAAAKYAACEQKAAAKFFSTGGFAAGKYSDVAAKCRTKYTARWTRLQAKANGTGATCDAARFVDNGDGTVTDNLTGLQWEQKTNDGSVHDKDDLHTWTVGGSGGTAADGTAFTSFLAALNGVVCFAGQCDWRLPTRAELQTILLELFPCATSPCIDQTVFGPTAESRYWTSTTDAISSVDVWDIYFSAGLAIRESKLLGGHVRAVRGGL